MIGGKQDTLAWMNDNRLTKRQKGQSGNLDRTKGEETCSNNNGEMNWCHIQRKDQDNFK